MDQRLGFLDANREVSPSRATKMQSLFALPPSFFNDASADVLGPSNAAAEEQELSAALQHLHTSEPSSPAPTSTQPVNSWSEAGATCLACGIGFGSAGFSSAAEQRAHFKTDWHRFNVKRRLGKQAPLNEEEFEAMVEGSGSQMSSISGSSSEESEDEVGPVTGQKKGGDSAPPRAMFKAQDGQLFCVWKCLLERDHVKGNVEPLTPPQQLTELQRLRSGSGLFVVLLLRGGHVAAAVFRAKCPAMGKHGQQAGQQPAQSGEQPQAAATSLAGNAHAKAADMFEVVAHKTFHRYVVRAKAGGRQSAKDASGKYAKSAGAALRRYNEAALDKDVSELLASWRAHLDAASLIFVQAPASNSRSVFAEATLEDNSRGTSLAAAGAGSSRLLINPSDPRVRRIPFVTQRPTFTEARRVVGLLLSVFEPTKAALAAQQAASEAAAAAAEQKAQKRLQRKQRKQTQAAVVVDGPQSALEPDVSSTGNKEAADEDAANRQIQETPLHTASREGNARLVFQLLEEGLDPCVRDSRGRTAYAVAADRESRDAFRRYMAEAPDQWDYGAAGVPSALTDDLQAAQAAKKAEKKARQKARDKERKGQTEEEKQAAADAAKAAMADEIARAAAEAAALAAKLNAKGGKGPSGKQVGGPGRAGQPAAGRGRGGGRAAPHPPAPTPEELARRRETMAAAAEARAKALQQATNTQRLY